MKNEAFLEQARKKHNQKGRGVEHLVVRQIYGRDLGRDKKSGMKHAEEKERRREVAVLQPSICSDVVYKGRD